MGNKYQTLKPPVANSVPQISSGPNRDLVGFVVLGAAGLTVACLPVSAAICADSVHPWTRWCIYSLLVVAGWAVIAIVVRIGRDAIQQQTLSGTPLSLGGLHRRFVAVELMGFATGLLAGALDVAILVALAIVVGVTLVCARYADATTAVRLGWVLPIWGVVVGTAGNVGFEKSVIVVVVLGVVTGVGVAIGLAVTRRSAAEKVVEVTGRHSATTVQPLHLLAQMGHQWVWGLPDRHSLALGPSRSGKTTGVVIPNALSWQAGSLVVASTKQDVLTAAAALRLNSGHVYLLDVLGVVPETSLPVGVTRIRWTPLRGCSTWATARARAGAMMGASRKSDITDAHHWTTQGERLLAPVLHAAALQQATMRQVMMWIATVDGLRSALAILHEHGASDAAAQLDGIVSQDSRPRDSVISTVATAMHAYSGHVLDEAAAAHDGDWKPEEFLGGANTLFVVAPLDSEIDDPAPIVVGVLAELYSAIRAQSDLAGGRLAVPSLWILDEVANISPLPRLPQWMAESAGRGLSMILGVQDFAQLESRWGRRDAATMWSNLSNKVVFPGISNTETLRQLETLAGKQWLQQESHSSGSSFGASHSLSSTKTRSLIEVPRWPAASIYGIAPGTCLVFRPDLAAPLHAHQARL